MIEVYGYVPAWGLPCISPYVTKLVYYLTMTKIPFKYLSQNLVSLDTDAPYGKLPYIINTEGGTKTGDSNLIIEYLKEKYGDTLDQDLSPTERAIGLAFDRPVCEHLHWSGIIEPRWRSDEGWETYIPYIVQGAEVTPELRKALDAFRVRILAGFDGQGMGRRDSAYVLELYKRDIDALSAFLGTKRYVLGDRVRSLDAGVYAMLRHLVDQPQKWKGTGYVDAKVNLVDYMKRMREGYSM